MKTRRGKAGVALVIMMASVLGLLWAAWGGRQTSTDESAEILSHFGLPPKEYNHLGLIHQLHYSELQRAFSLEEGQARRSWS